MPNNILEILCVSDSSGSMAAIKTDAEGGYNAFIEEQKKGDGKVFVTLVTFNNLHQVIYEAKPVHDVPVFSLVPRGGTALYDAIGHAINSTTARHAEMKEEDRPSKVIFIISTDGAENCSTEFNRAQVNDMIRHQEIKHGWETVYLGANQDAFAVGQMLGIQKSRIVNYAASSVGTQALYRGLSAAVSSNRASASLGMESALSYTQADYTVALDNNAVAIAEGKASEIKDFMSKVPDMGTTPNS